MNTRFPLRSALVGAALLLPLPAFSQSAESPEPGAAMGETYVAGTFRDWEVICTPVDEEGLELCEMYQLLADQERNPVAEITITLLPPESGLLAGATVTTPLETYLPAGIGWQIGDAEARREGFQVCTAVGCVARIGFEEAEVEAMKAASEAVISIMHVMSLGEMVSLPVSLLGFTAALADLQARTPEMPELPEATPAEDDSEQAD